MNKHFFVDSVVEWLKRRVGDEYDFGSKSTRAILWCPWERHFTGLFSIKCCWSTGPLCRLSDKFNSAKYLDMLSNIVEPLAQENMPPN